MEVKGGTSKAFGEGKLRRGTRMCPRRRHGPWRQDLHPVLRRR